MTSITLFTPNQNPFNTLELVKSPSQYPNKPSILIPKSVKVRYWLNFCEVSTDYLEKFSYLFLLMKRLQKFSKLL